MKLKTKYLIFPLIVSETVLLDEAWSGDRVGGGDPAGVGGMEASCVLKLVIYQETFIGSSV